MSAVIGKQSNGGSPSSIKSMALKALDYVGIDHFDTIADIGAGKGDLFYLLGHKANKIIMLDDFVVSDLPGKVDIVRSDLNLNWQISDNYIDFLFSLEVLEHIENPRHFFREIRRILKPNAYGFVSTPNNLNIFSKLNFLLFNCHRFFQNSCYPAHITAINKIDLERILKENGLKLVSFFYNNEDTIPKLGIRTNFKGQNFSSSIGVLFQKQ